MLLRYLAQRDEEGLQAAYELGRARPAVSRLGLLDVVRVHNELFLEVLATARARRRRPTTSHASSTTLLIDLVASYDMSQRGFMDAQRESGSTG